MLYVFVLGGKESPQLRSADLPIWTQKRCDDAYFQPIQEMFICAGYADGRKDACQVRQQSVAAASLTGYCRCLTADQHQRTKHETEKLSTSKYETDSNSDFFAQTCHIYKHDCPERLLTLKQFPEQIKASPTLSKQ